MIKNLKALFLMTVIAVTVFTMANTFINTATATVQTSANLVEEILQVKNVSNAAIGPNMAVVLDTASVELGILGVKAATTVDNLSFVGYTRDTIEVGKYGPVVHKGFATATSNAAISENTEVGTTATSGKVDAGSGAGICVSGATDANQKIKIYLK